MKFGLTRANLIDGGTAAAARTIGGAAESLGFDSVWTSEHVAWPASFTSKYPFSPDGSVPPGTTTSSFPEPLVWLTYVAAMCPSLQLATGVVVLPQREPVLFAKQAATLDYLSGGRLVLAIGVGWLREEFEILGAPWEHRGQRTEDCLAVLRALWTTTPTYVRTESVVVEGAIVVPKPARRIPLLIGGGRAGAVRAGRVADGYLGPPSADAGQLRELVAAMRQAAETAGRDPSSLEVIVQCEPDPRRVEEYAAVGVDRVLISAISIDPEDRDVTRSSAGRSVDVMERVARRLFPHFAS